MLYHLLLERTLHQPRAMAVIGETRRLSYGEFLHEVNSFAAHIEALGLASGDSILIGIPASPEFHVAFFAAASQGFVIIPVLPSGKIPEVIRGAEPKAAVGSGAFLQLASEFCPSVRKKILFGPDAPRSYTHSDDWSPRMRFGDHPTLAVSSSGTTGEPTLYMRTARQIVDRAAMRAAAHELHADDILFTTRPYNSGSAINNHVIMPEFVGCAVVVHERFERTKAAQAISDEKVTVLWAVPFFFEMLSTVSRDRRLDFSAVRMCISGSAALSPGVASQFEERYGLIVRQRYGGSQIHPAFTFNLNGPRDSVGRVDGLFPIVILDERGDELAPDHMGEIAFKVAQCPDLWRASLAAKPNYKDGYLYSGDLGRADRDGNVYIVGRKSPFVKVGANRVEPAEVENVLRLHPLVSEAVAYGVRLGVADECLCADVITLGEVSEKELVAFCAEKLDSYKCPRRIAIKNDLPRNIHGKVIRPVPAGADDL